MQSPCPSATAFHHRDQVLGSCTVGGDMLDCFRFTGCLSSWCIALAASRIIKHHTTHLRDEAVHVVRHHLGPVLGMRRGQGGLDGLIDFRPLGSFLLKNAGREGTNATMLQAPDRACFASEEALWFLAGREGEHGAIWEWLKAEAGIGLQHRRWPLQ